MVRSEWLGLAWLTPPREEDEGIGPYGDTGSDGHAQRCPVGAVADESGSADGSQHNGNKTDCRGTDQTRTANRGSADDGGDRRHSQEDPDKRVDGQADWSLGHRSGEARGNVGAVVGGGQMAVEVHPNPEAVLDKQDHDRSQAVSPESSGAVGGALGIYYGRTHSMTFPPEISKVAPVIHDEASEAKNNVAAATSSG